MISVSKVRVKMDETSSSGQNGMLNMCAELASDCDFRPLYIGGLGMRNVGEVAKRFGRNGVSFPSIGKGNASRGESPELGN